MAADGDATILVVDDDEDIRGLLAVVLGVSGYRVRCAEDGAVGLASVAAERPDLIVLDLMMPVLDGWEVLERLHASAHPPPVIVLSAAPDAGRAAEAGAIETLAKPFEPAVLVAACRRALGA